MQTHLSLLQAPTDAEEACYIDTPTGVVSMLDAIALAGSRTAAYIDGGETYIPTTLIGVAGKPPALVFEKGPDEELNARLLDTREITFVTSDQGVPVQFTSGRPAVVSQDGVEAFTVTVPERVLRLQRRMYYRLPGEPVHVLLKCEMPCDAGGEPATLRPSVLDLSIGGLAAAVPAEAPVLELGSRTMCMIEFPGLGRVESIVQVRSECVKELPDRQEARRYGFEFLNLNAKSAALIQRFILEQQRARRRVDA